MKSKSGGLDLSLENLGGLILAVIIIIGLTIFASNLFGVFSGNQKQQVSTNNFDALILGINQLVEASGEKTTKEGFEITIIPAEKNKVQIVVPLFIDKGYSILAFDSENISRTCGLPPGTGKPIEKPQQCLSLPCVCLAKQDVGGVIPEENGGYVKCVVIKSVSKISVTKESVNNYGGFREDAPGSYLFLRYNCGSSPLFGVRNVKVIREPSIQPGKFNLLFDVQ